MKDSWETFQDSMSELILGVLVLLIASGVTYPIWNNTIVENFNAPCLGFFDIFGLYILASFVSSTIKGRGSSNK